MASEQRASRPQDAVFSDTLTENIQILFKVRCLPCATWKKYNDHRYPAR